jgi:hypothetical protein
MVCTCACSHPLPSAAPRNQGTDCRSAHRWRRINADEFIEFLKRLIVAPSERSFSLSIVDPCIARRRRKPLLKLWAANYGCFFCLPIRPTAIQMSLCGNIRKPIPSAAWRSPARPTSNTSFDCLCAACKTTPEESARSISSTLRILCRVAERFRESFHEGGWNFYTVGRMPGH